MTDIFHTKIRQALSDANLQAALDMNADRRIQARQTAIAEMPDYPDLRQHAHAMRLNVVKNLDSYLDQFIHNASENGMVVHRAADAAEAVAIILDIARQKGARLVAKSKTMVSEEIELNPALEAQGIRVVETDLGEFIVQLRGERPSHIVAPAVHLRRAQVGQTFHEKLGIPYTEDVDLLTDAAREVLREVFLTADIGLSGVNFGVAETGTLCVLTNEGNGRMVTTVPSVHIALMGIERLVPTLDDLALMLTLLPPTATGQKMTVYASLVNGPRRPGDPDGPIERHLVLVDNGRRALRSSPMAEALLCIRCGACLNACPVFRRLGGHAYVSAKGQGSSYTGPIGSVLSPALFGQAEFGHLARASSLCGACWEACPVDIDLPQLLLRARAGGLEMDSDRPHRHVPLVMAWGLRLYAWMATSPWRFHLAQKLAGLFSRLAAPRSGWLPLPPLTGWGLSRDFPSPTVRPFRERFNQRTRSSQSPANEIRKTEGSLSQAQQVNPAPTAQPLPEESLQDRFAVVLESTGGHFTVCEADQLPQQVAGLLRQHGITEVAAWGSDYFPEHFLEAVSLEGIRLVAESGPQVRAGLTGALAAAAESGTLLLPGGPGMPLKVSLLPEIHIAVLKSSAILPGLAQLLALPAVHQSAAAALVSGPSRTGDIELTLTIGVHGPKELHVFCVIA